MRGVLLVVDAVEMTVDGDDDDDDDDAFPLCILFILLSAFRPRSVCSAGGTKLFVDWLIDWLIEHWA